MGVSPRGAIPLDKYARLAGRDHAAADDVRAIVRDALRHRLMLSYEASADGVSTNDVIDRIVKQVAVAG